MGIYSNYLEKNMDFNAITAERKRLLTELAALRGNRDVLVYASDMNKGQAQISIDFTDIIAFQDQLANLNGKAIDIILETPGGFAEVVEDLVNLVREKYDDIGIIIPGYSKSAGTIFAMAADEILMGSGSALGPIDAQILTNGKRYSAEAFLEGLNKIKNDSLAGLNLAYVPILQNISPGEIQHCENAQNFSKKLVTEWLAKYKFSKWKTHSTTGVVVTEAEKMTRAEEIATKLCSHSHWLTHGRSIKIKDFNEMRLQITDYSTDAKLNDVITRYYALLRITFDGTGIYKIFETNNSQIMRFVSMPVPAQPQKAASAKFNIKCVGCSRDYVVQANFQNGVPYEPGTLPYPIENDTFVCPTCSTKTNLSQARLQLESQIGSKIQK